MEGLAESLRLSIGRREFVVLVADCEVEYKGRASSKLGRGERVVLIKGDGSVVVHRPTGSSPINYQPEGSIVSTRVEGGRLIVRAVRPRPEEELVVTVYRVIGLYAFKLGDSAEFSMWGDESDLKRAILLEPREFLGEELRPVGEEERLGSAGFADLLFADTQGNLVVVEVKKDTAGVDAVYQLKRYVERLRKNVGSRVRGLLVAPGFTKSALAALEREGLEYKRVSARRASKALRRTRSARLSGGARLSELAVLA